MRVHNSPPAAPLQHEQDNKKSLNHEGLVPRRTAGTFVVVFVLPLSQETAAMHSAYNYTGLIDVTAELMKLKRKEARQDADACPAESTSIGDDDYPAAVASNPSGVSGVT